MESSTSSTLRPLNSWLMAFSFLPHRFTPRGLSGHDEGTPDVAVLDEALAIGQVEARRQCHRRRPAGIGNRDHRVDLQVRHGVANLVGQIVAHLGPRLVHRNAVHHRIGARQIDELEHAGCMEGAFGALPADEIAAGIDQDGFTGLDVAQHLEAQGIEGHALRGHQVLGALGVSLRPITSGRMPQGSRKASRP
jgi:hypothetical protein